MADSFESLHRQIEAADRLRRQMDPYLGQHRRLVEIARAAIVPATVAIDFYLQHREQFVRSIESFQRAHNSIELATKAQQLHEILNRHENLAATFRRQNEFWEKLEVQHHLMISAPAFRDSILEANSAWRVGLAEAVERLNKMNLLETRAAFSARLLEPYAVFTDFSERTIDRIERTRSPRIAKALDASITLAEGQVLATSDSFLISQPVLDDNATSDDLTLNLLDEQQRDLLNAAELPENGSPELLLSLSQSATTATEARTLVSMIIQCNEAMKAVGKPEVFKPTTRLVESCTNLPWIVPTNKRTFDEFIDYLYFIFYEGAGKDKLRFLVDQQGVLTADECDFIWCIKHLRNKWSRHDADHGKESEIRKSWKELNEKFKYLGLGRYPIYRSDFHSLHQGLLRAGGAFLNLMLEKIATTRAED